MDYLRRVKEKEKKDLISRYTFPERKKLEKRQQDFTGVVRKDRRRGGMSVIFSWNRRENNSLEENQEVDDDHREIQHQLTDPDDNDCQHLHCDDDHPTHDEFEPSVENTERNRSSGNQEIMLILRIDDDDYEEYQEMTTTHDDMDNNSSFSHPDANDGEYHLITTSGSLKKGGGDNENNNREVDDIRMFSSCRYRKPRIKEASDDEEIPQVAEENTKRRKSQETTKTSTRVKHVLDPHHQQPESSRNKSFSTSHPKGDQASCCYLRHDSPLVPFTSSILYSIMNFRSQTKHLLKDQQENHDHEMRKNKRQRRFVVKSSHPSSQSILYMSCLLMLMTSSSSIYCLAQDVNQQQSSSSLHVNQTKSATSDISSDYSSSLSPSVPITDNNKDLVIMSSPVIPIPPFRHTSGPSDMTNRDTKSNNNDHNEHQNVNRANSEGLSSSSSSSPDATHVIKDNDDNENDADRDLDEDKRSSSSSDSSVNKITSTNNQMRVGDKNPQNSDSSASVHQVTLPIIHSNNDHNEHIVSISSFSKGSSSDLSLLSKTSNRNVEDDLNQQNNRKQESPVAAENDVGEDAEDDEEESEGPYIGFNDLTTHPHFTSSASSPVSPGAEGSDAVSDSASLPSSPASPTSSSSKETNPTHHDPEDNHHHIASSSNSNILNIHKAHDDKSILNRQQPNVDETNKKISGKSIIIDSSSSSSSTIRNGNHDANLHLHLSQHEFKNDDYEMMFRFTKDHYNVSIAEDAPGKTYASVIIDNRVQISDVMISSENHYPSTPLMIHNLHHMRHDGNNDNSRLIELSSRDNFYSNNMISRHNDMVADDPYLMMGVFVGPDPNIIVKYKISSGDDRKMFKAESRRVGDFFFCLIRTRSSEVGAVLNREYQEFFYLKVRASISSKRDKSLRLKSRCDVTVRVEDANDLSPLFYPTLYNLDVPEDTPLDKSVLKVTAFDPDIGVNGEIYYSLDPNDKNQDFTVHPTQGIISVTRPLTARYRNSRGAHHKRQLMIYARDRERGSTIRGSLAANTGSILASQSRATVNINIVPVNRDKDDFDFNNSGEDERTSSSSSLSNKKYHHDASAYHFSVAENSKFATIVGVINETDTDNSTIFKYKLINYKNKFTIDYKTGLLSVKGFLDREEQDLYKLYASVSDSHPSTQSSTATIIVTVTDVNDNPPIFREKTYYARVREDLPIGSVIMRMRAYDVDLGSGGIIKYSIGSSPDQSSVSSSSQNDHESFSIDELMGTVRIAKELDFEKRQVYNLTIVAKDEGVPSYSSTTHLLVEIEDVDENQFAPRFNDFVLTGDVKENSPVGTYVMTVTAVDDDDPSQVPSYQLVAGSGLGKFSIDEEGRITTGVVFDREYSDRYWLMVMAKDKSAIPKTSHVNLFIRINDENDCSPHTIEPFYFATIKENATINTSVLKLEATDDDLNGDDFQINYRMVNIDTDIPFSIDKMTGEIKTKEKLDREIQAQYILDIEISEVNNQNGHVLMSKTPVIINIENVNDNSPQLLSQIIRCQAYNSLPKEIPVCHVIAYDMDDVDSDQAASSGTTSDRSSGGASGSSESSLVFEIIEGNDYSFFRIDRNTGSIYFGREGPIPVKTYDLTVSFFSHFTSLTLFFFLTYDDPPE